MMGNDWGIGGSCQGRNLARARSKVMGSGLRFALGDCGCAFGLDESLNKRRDRKRPNIGEGPTLVKVYLWRGGIPS